MGSTASIFPISNEIHEESVTLLCYMVTVACILNDFVCVCDHYNHQLVEFRKAGWD